MTRKRKISSYMITGIHINYGKVHYHRDNEDAANEIFERLKNEEFNGMRRQKAYSEVYIDKVYRKKTWKAETK